MTNHSTRSASPGRALRLRGKLALALGSTLVALAVLEIACRVRSGSYGPTTNTRYTIHDRELGWRYKPGVHAHHDTRHFSVEVRTNSEGFRDLPFPEHENGPRILALGDSLTFGWGVEVQDCFANQIEKILGVPVLNCGVSGYSTDQQLLLWRRLGRQLAPDVVLLTVCGNDPYEAAHDFVYGRHKPFFDGEPLQPTNLPLERSFLDRYSHLYRALVKNWTTLTRPKFVGPRLDTARLHVARLMEILAHEIDAAGAALVVVSFESPWLAESLSADAPLYLLDLGPALTGAAHSGPLDFGDDPHWNGKGHRIVAETVSAFLRERSLLP